MIVTVTTTIMDGTVVRWYHDTTPLDQILNVEPVVSASRNGVLVGTYLHKVPAEVLTGAQSVHADLRRDHHADVRHLATHRRRGMFGPYEPAPKTED